MESNAVDASKCCDDQESQCRVCSKRLPLVLYKRPFSSDTWWVDKKCHNALRSLYRMVQDKPELRRKLEEKIDEDWSAFVEHVMSLVP